MDDFFKMFSVAGLQLVLVIPFVVGGIRKAYEEVKNAEMPPVAVIATVVLVTWLLLAADAVEKAIPGAQLYVRYGLGALLLPLWCLGAYSGTKWTVKQVAAGKG
jgi:hypothetical protein